MYNLKYISDNGKIINFSPLLGYIITKTDGLTENDITLAETQGVMQVGSTIQHKSVQPKTIVINGQISGQSAPKRAELLTTIVPKVSGVLVFDNKLQIRVEPKLTPSVERSMRNARFQFSLRAPYPYWRNIDQVRANVAGKVKKFKFPVNYKTPHKFGERIATYFVNVLNEGNVPANFKATFIAITDLVSPKITKVATGEYIKINKPMAAGEQITVDMLDGIKITTTDLQGKEIDAIRHLDRGSQLFSIDPGDNLIRCDSDLNREGLYCNLFFNHTYSAAFGDDLTYV